jgi:hypothetical protein
MSGIWILFVVPAIAGFLALYFGIQLLRRTDRPYANTKFRKMLGLLCLLVALGIGACYGFMIMGNY